MSCKQSVIHINILLNRFKSAQKRFLKSISCPYMLCYVICYVMLCYVMLCYVMLCYVMLCYVMLCYVMLCHVMLCYVILCFVMLWLLLKGYMKGNPRRSWILNSTPWNPDHQILDSRFPVSVEVGFKISVVSGIPDFLSCIPDSTNKKKISWILESLLDLTWSDHTLWVILEKSFRYLVT